MAPDVPYDAGVTAGPGVLSKDAALGSVNWSGLSDNFSRVGNETNSVTHRAAYGRLNGPATTTISFFLFRDMDFEISLLTTEIAGLY